MDLSQTVMRNFSLFNLKPQTNQGLCRTTCHGQRNFVTAEANQDWCRRIEFYNGNGLNRSFSGTISIYPLIKCLLTRVNTIGDKNLEAPVIFSRRAPSLKNCYFHSIVLRNLANHSPKVTIRQKCSGTKSVCISNSKCKILLCEIKH